MNTFRLTSPKVSYSYIFQSNKSQIHYVGKNLLRLSLLFIIVFFMLMALSIISLLA